MKRVLWAQAAEARRADTLSPLTKQLWKPLDSLRWEMQRKEAHK